MKVTFILPEALNKPVGGYKMVYEYANMLSLDGNDVTILHTYTSALLRHPKLPVFLKKIVYLWRYPRTINWFAFNANVKIKRKWEIKDKTVPDADIVVATAYETAKPVSLLSDKKGKKIYFIQGYENWAANDSDLAVTYSLGMKNIVVSSWLEEIVDQYSMTPSVLVKNGIDLNSFYVEKEFSERTKHSLAFMWSVSENKGSKYGLEAIKKLKSLYPDLKVNMFGIEPRSDQIESWISYCCCANEEQLRKIFNDSRVYLCSSLAEGFGLTGVESMACGCVLVSTDTNGVREYAEREFNSVLCPIKNTDALVKSVTRVFEDDDFANKLAIKGENTASNSFSLMDAYKKFRTCLYE